MKDKLQLICSCDVCQAHKTSNTTPTSLLQPIPILLNICSEISMDLVDDLLPSQGKTSILLVVDKLSKYTNFNALKHPYTA